MVKHMKLMGVAGAILLVVAGAAVASNMGFKFTANIATGTPDIYDVSIPLNNNYSDLVSIYNDINTSTGCTAALVSSFNENQTSCDWIGSGCNRPYIAGQAVRVSTAGSCLGWIIVGSHNPSLVYSFPNPDPAIYDISVPYHTTRTDMASLCAEIPNCSLITKFRPNQTTCDWIGSGCNEPITIGQGYRISVSGTSTWIPSHY